MMAAEMPMVSLSTNQGCGLLRASRRERAASLMMAESLRDLRCSPDVVVGIFGAFPGARTMFEEVEKGSQAHRR